MATRKRRSAFLFVVKDLFSGCLLLVLGSVTRLSTWCFQRFSQFYPEIRGNDPIWLAHIFQMSWNHLVFCCGHQVSKWHSASTRLIDKDAWILLGFFTFRPQLGFDWCLKGAVLFTSLLWQPPWCAQFGYLFQSIWMIPFLPGKTAFKLQWSRLWLAAWCDKLK